MNGSPGIAFFNQGGTIGLNADYGFTSFYAAEISGSAPAAALTKLALTEKHPCSLPTIWPRSRQVQLPAQSTS